MFCLWVVLKISCIRKHRSSKQNAKEWRLLSLPKFFFPPWVINDDTAVGGCSTQSWRKLQDINNWILCHHLLTTCKVSVVARQTDSSPAYCSKADALSTPQSTPVSRSICPIQSPFCLWKNELQKLFKSIHPRIYSSFKNENTYQSLYDIQMHIRINFDQLLG